MSSFRKRNNLWQAQVRNKQVGLISNYLKSNGGKSLMLFFRAFPQLFDIFSK